MKVQGQEENTYLTSASEVAKPAQPTPWVEQRVSGLLSHTVWLLCHHLVSAWFPATLGLMENGLIPSAVLQSPSSLSDPHG